MVRIVDDRAIRTLQRDANRRFVYDNTALPFIIDSLKLVATLPHYRKIHSKNADILALDDCKNGDWQRMVSEDSLTRLLSPATTAVNSRDVVHSIDPST